MSAEQRWTQSRENKRSATLVLLRVVCGWGEKGNETPFRDAADDVWEDWDGGGESLWAALANSNRVTSQWCNNLSDERAGWIQISTYKDNRGGWGMMKFTSRLEAEGHSSQKHQAWMFTTPPPRSVFKICLEPSSLSPSLCSSLCVQQKQDEPW